MKTMIVELINNLTPKDAALLNLFVAGGVVIASLIAFLIRRLFVFLLVCGAATLSVLHDGTNCGVFNLPLFSTIPSAHLETCLYLLSATLLCRRTYKPSFLN